MKRVVVLSLILLIFFTVLPAAAVLENRYTISIPYSTSSSVRAGNYDEYVFTASGSGQITVTLTPGDSNEDPDLYVWVILNGVRNYIGSSVRGAGSTDSVTFNAVSGNTYVVRVAGFSGGEDSIVTYRLSITGNIAATTPTPTTNDRYEPNDASSSATPISAPTRLTGLYLTADDEDWFRFSIQSRSQVTIYTFSSGTPSVDTVLYLYSGSLTQIASDDDGGSGLFSRISRTLDPGTYYIKVRSYGSDYGYYGLAIEVSAIAQPTPTPTPIPTPATGGAPEEIPPPPFGVPEWAWDTIYQWMIQPLRQATNAFWNIIINGLNAIGTGITNIINAVFSPIVEGLRVAGEAIVNAFRTIFDAVGNALRTIFYGGGGE